MFRRSVDPVVGLLFSLSYVARGRRVEISLGRCAEPRADATRRILEGKEKWSDPYLAVCAIIKVNRSIDHRIPPLIIIFSPRLRLNRFMLLLWSM